VRLKVAELATFIWYFCLSYSTQQAAFLNSTEETRFAIPGVQLWKHPRGLQKHQACATELESSDFVKMLLKQGTRTVSLQKS
jgi:hypothetical protein